MAELFLVELQARLPFDSPKVSTSPIPDLSEHAVPVLCEDEAPDPNECEVPDQSERDRALDTSSSWIVEAPAGSGKTGLLIQRFLKLLASPSVNDPAEVLAVTFTRKATNEMRQRVLTQLADAHAATEPANAFDRVTRPLAQAVLTRSAQLGWELLDHPRSLNIRTIDSVCSDIARALPILSGGGGSQSPIEDAQPLLAEAARRTLLLLGGPDLALTAALEVLLLHRDGNLRDCESLIASMLQTRDQWGELVPLSRHDLDESFLDTNVLPKFEKALDLAICRALTRLTQILPASILDRLCSLAAEMAHAEGYQGAPSPIAICKGLNHSPQEKAEDLDHWRALIHLLIKPSKPRDWRRSLNRNAVKFEIIKQHQAELKDIISTLAETPGLFAALRQIECLPPSRYPEEQWVVTKALFRVLSSALVELQLVFVDHNQCDFAELSLRAKAALRREDAINDLTASSGTRLQHLLVDEMQDTSSSQYELIQLLTQYWDGHSQTVFLVGDPKQSIYLFRQACVERFVSTMRSAKLGDLSLGNLHLTANFRSQANLVNAFNQDFSRIFPAHVDATDAEIVPYRPASAVRSASNEQDRVWHASALPYSSVPAECSAFIRTQTALNAQEIRHIVELWRARPLPPERIHPYSEPWKIAVLVRSRTHLLSIINEFKGSASSVPIPYRAIDIEPLGERQEILDLVALTRALLHPADRTAWLALLRTPWCGLGLRDLHLLAGEDDPVWAEHNVLDLIRERGDLLSEDGISRLIPFWTTMQTALNLRERLPLSRWVERTWHTFGARPYATEEALANINRYLLLLDDLEEAGGTLNLSMLNHRLDKLYASPSLSLDAVDLMTIHGAKGLEWDVVLVPTLERVGQISRGRLLSWLQIDEGDDPGQISDQAAHGIIAPIESKGRQSLQLNRWMRSIDSTREAAESKRLFYVACTRAREELHLFASPARKKDGGLSVPSSSLLSSAWPAAEERFRPLEVPVLTMQPSLKQLMPYILDSIAASSAAPRLIQRIPLSTTNTLIGPAAAYSPIQLPFERPEGSFSARVFGNSMHAFLEVLASRIAAAASPSTLLAELPSWSGRISAVLRSNGLSPQLVERLSIDILRGLTNTLQHPDGQWILANHPQAASERALTTWNGQRSSIRLDRYFLAGPEPHVKGSEVLWIIDYKTATHGSKGVEAFLHKEQRKYRAQLETYARSFERNHKAMRLALFYPMLARLVWWDPHAPEPRETI